MTKITYHIGVNCCVRIEGHACAPRQNGNDLCCAAESMLACTLVNTIQKLPLVKRYIYVADGSVCVSFGSVCLHGVAGIGAVKTIINGFELLQEKYPDNVSVQCERRICKSE